MKSGRYTHNAVLYIKNCFPGGISYVTKQAWVFIQLYVVYMVL